MRVASTNITGFSNNTVHQDTAGAGVVLSNVTFNSSLVTAGFQLSRWQQLDDPSADGGGTNGVGAAGMSLTTVQGSLFFDDLDVYGASGLGVLGTGGWPPTCRCVVNPVGAGGTRARSRALADSRGSASPWRRIDLRLSEFSSDSDRDRRAWPSRSVGGSVQRAVGGSTITKTARITGRCSRSTTRRLARPVLTSAYAGTWGASPPPAAGRSRSATLTPARRCRSAAR